MHGDAAPVTFQLFEDGRDGLYGKACPAMLFFKITGVADGHAVIGADVDENTRFFVAQQFVDKDILTAGRHAAGDFGQHPLGAVITVAVEVMAQFADHGAAVSSVQSLTQTS